MKDTAAYVHPASITHTQSARILYAKREQILTEWLKRVKAEVKTAGVLLNPIIINTIPLFIERLSESLCEECERETATESSNFAQEHGSERARVTQYGPEQVIQEYQILREVIRSHILTATTMSEREENVIQKSFDKGIQESMIAYFLIHSRMREQFVATLTHDMRNPVGAVKLATDLINETLVDNSNQELISTIRMLTGRIFKQTNRMERMIQDLLDASVVSVGEPLSLYIQAGDIKDIVTEAVGERPPLESDRLQIELTSVKGFWDIGAFQRSIENLISNAFKYGDVDKNVTVRIQTAHDRIMVSVHNYGPPIPAENLESLFQVFRRAEAAKKGNVKGWGIGLALARSTAERMGGSLAVDSSAEQGTTFTIDVPCDARPFQGEANKQI